MHRRPLFVGMLVGLQACASNVPAPPAEPAPAANRVTRDAPALPPLGHSSILGTMDVATTSFGAVTLGNHVYTLGGYTGSPHEYSREFQSERFARLDLTTNQWTALPTPGPTQSATLNAHGGAVIRVGGLRIHNAEGEAPQLSSITDVALFDTATNQWRAATSLPEPRSSHASVILGDKLYVLGGWTLNGGMGSGKSSRTMLVADLSHPTLTWSSFDVPFETRGLAATHWGRHLVVIGGMSGRRVHRAVHLFDTESGTWSEGPALPEPGFGVSAVTLDDTVFVVAASGTVYRLAPTADRWDTHAELIFPRLFHAAVAVPSDRILVLGGIASTLGDRVRHIEQISSTPTPFTRWSLAAPSPAKNRQGLLLRGNRLLTFGGNKALGQHDFAEENFLRSSFELDLGSFRWIERPPFPHAVQSVQTTLTPSGMGVAVGGFGPNDTGLAARADVYHYDPPGETWHEVEALPHPRTQFGLAEHEASLWIFGGMKFDDSREGDAAFSYPTTVLVRPIDSTAGFTESQVQIPAPRRAFAGALHGNRYYMFGGMAEGFAPVETCEAFDFSTKAWISVTCPSRVRISGELVALGDKLYLIGGRSRDGADSKLEEDRRVEVYDPQADTWALLTDTLPISTQHLRAFAQGQRIWLYTAHNETPEVVLALLDPMGFPNH